MLTDQLQQDNYNFTEGDLSLIQEMQATRFLFLCSRSLPQFHMRIAR